MTGVQTCALSIYQTWAFNLEKKNEGIRTASKVQYVYEGYNFKKLCYSWNGKMRVLNQILSRDWLRTRIRIMGGAYGASASISPTGMIYFSSYRDPNLKETFETYQGAADYLTKFEADEPGMTRFIIGTIAGMDMPQSNVQRGDQAVNYYFTKRKAEDLQRDRDAVITTKVEDIRGFAGMIREMVNQRNYCVYGNSDKLNASKELFDNMIQVDR